MRMTPKEYEAYIERTNHVLTVKEKKDRAIPAPSLKKQSSKLSGTPNKTEAEYGKLLQLEFPLSTLHFEGFTLRMANGHKYTPDWIVCHEDWILCVEVKARGKNGFRQASYGRAKLAFNQCRVEWSFAFRWAEKQGGIWDVKTY